MKSVIRRIKFLKNKYTPWYIADFKKFIKLSGNNDDFLITNNFPCTKDKFLSSGISSGHYFHQDIFVAREIFKAQPIRHIDVGSRIDGFIAHLAVFREVEVFDIRPLENDIKNVVFKQADFMKTDLLYEDYCDSISCLHTIEHFGLGRYGDEIDPNGHLKGFKAISGMLKSKGTFYFSVPMGPNRIEFNAHRIFGLKYLINWIQVEFDIMKFAYIDDYGCLKEDVKLNNDLIENNCNCSHGCAIFVLKKK